MSSSEKLKAVLRAESSDDVKVKTKYSLEIWDKQKCVMNFDLAALDLHGVVYTDGNL